MIVWQVWYTEIRRKDGMLHKIVSEYAKRIYAYLEKTPRDTKLCISQLIIIRILNFLDSFYLQYMGWINPNNHLTLLSL
jgi:hypothetical protein